MDFRRCTFLLLVGILTLSGSTGMRVLPQEAPRISLKSYIQVDDNEEILATDFQGKKIFENEFVSMNGTEYVVSEANQVQFNCEAKYPVMWTFKYPEQFSGMENYVVTLNPHRGSTFTKKMKAPITQNYSVSLWIHNPGYRFDAGYLECQHVNNPKLKSTIYVYLQGQIILENQGLTTIINSTDGSSRPVVLPCRPISPDTPVVLAKEMKIKKPTPTPKSLLSMIPNPFGGGKHGTTTTVRPLQTNQTTSTTQWVPVPLSSSVQFDPRRGFILDKAKLGNVYRRYKCYLEEEENEVYSLVEVTKGPEIVSFKFTPVKVTSTYGRVKVNPVANQISCCSGKTDEPATGISFNCENEAACELLKPTVMYDYLTKKRPSYSSYHNYDERDCYDAYLDSYNFRSTLLMCDGGNVKLHVVAQYLVGYPNLTTTATHSTYPIYNNARSVFDISEGTGALDQDDKIRIVVSSSTRNPDYYGDVYYPSRYKRFAGRRRHYIGRHVLPRIGGNIVEGERITVACFGLQYFYALGGWLQLNWRNGSKTIMSSNVTLQIRGSRVYSPLFYQMEMFAPPGSQNDRVVFGVIEAANLNMESVDCYQPVWNSAKWDKMHLKFNVTPSVLPTFEHPETKVLNVKFNQTGVILNCTVHATENMLNVPTTVTWERDGKDLQLLPYVHSTIGETTISMEGNTTIYSLQFYPMDLDMQGEYKCVVHMVKGKVEKVFKVYVDSEKGSGKRTAAIIIVTIGVILAVVIGGLAYWHLSLRHKLGRLPQR